VEVLQGYSLLIHRFATPAIYLLFCLKQSHLIQERLFSSRFLSSAKRTSLQIEPVLLCSKPTLQPECPSRLELLGRLS
jgi:hypothetical protein